MECYYLVHALFELRPPCAHLPPDSQYLPIFHTQVLRLVTITVLTHLVEVTRCYHYLIRVLRLRRCLLPDQPGLSYLLCQRINKKW